MYPRVLDHLAKVTDNEYGIEGVAVPMQEFPETFQQLEQEVDHFHRITVQKNGDYQIKITRPIDDRMPLPHIDLGHLVSNFARDTKI